MHSDQAAYHFFSVCTAPNINFYLTCLRSVTAYHGHLPSTLLTAPDEEHTTEHTPNHHMPQPPQAVFPACICAAVLPIVHLMEDGEVREDGVAGTDLDYTSSDSCLGVAEPAST